MTTPRGLRATEVADLLLADLAAHDVVAAQTLGLVPDSFMPTLAPADFAARHQALLRARQSLDPADSSVLARVLRERLSSDLALDGIGFTTSLLAPLATPVHAVRQVFDSLPADRVDEHLALVPGALGDYAKTLLTSQRTVAVRQILGAANQCEKWVLADGFFAGLGGSATRADEAAAATMEFASFLRETLLPRAPMADAVGREVYEVTSRAFLGEAIDLAETYAFGWEELARLTDEMSLVAGSLGFSSVEEAAAALDADAELRLSVGSLEGWLQDRIDAVVEAVDGIHFDLPAAARAPVARISPTAVGVMYYDAPDPAFTRPGQVWWAPPASGETSSWHEVTTVHHEGVPGHHLQIVTAMTSPDLHPWQRTMVHVHGYAEGWAHYAERLADELGLLRDDAERLGMLFGQRWRAARIVIDLGLHLGFPIPRNAVTSETAWTPALGRDLLTWAARCDPTTARFEIDRYLGWPGQALAFRVGSRLWEQVRASAATSPGFDLRTFHMQALRLGPMGLSTLREVTR